MLIRYEEAEIRKLQSQVLDTQKNVQNQFRTENLQKLYRLTGATPTSSGPGNLLSEGTSATRDPDSQPYHDHLNASLQVFRAKRWRPLTPDEVPGTSVTRCRLISGRPSSCKETTLSLALPLRPNSEPTVRPDSRQSASYTHLYQRRPDTPRVTPGNFDTLSPRILSHLVTDPRPRTPTSSYGDVIETMRRPRRPKRKTQTHHTDASSDFGPHDVLGGRTEGDAVSGVHIRLREAEENGFDSGNNVGDDDGDDVDDSDTDSDSDSDTDNDSISELEKGNEPPVDSSRKVPDLHLRPERLDNVYTPESKRDLRRFDFDAEKVDIPVYEFECPIPAPFTRINFRFHARENSNWRMHQANLGPADPVLSAMFDRLVDIERMQIETEEWEEKRLRSLKKRPASRAASANRAATTATAMSSSGASRDKRCCSSCLQAACVGDCPAKRVPLNCCENCRQPLCTGTCKETKYDQRSRQPRDDASAANASLPPRGPRSCRSCQKRHTAKLINANNVVLGRPNSAFSTFSRGKHSAKPKSDLRPTSAFNLSECIAKGIEKLGLDAVQPPSSAKPARPRSRGDMIPGKTYFSNLSHSLTDLSPKRKRRTKSAKARSLRTPPT